MPELGEKVVKMNMKKIYLSIEELIRANLNTKEKDKDAKIFEKMKDSKRKGYLTKAEFYEICMWKSSRPKKYYLMNSEKQIKKTSTAVILTNFEKRKIDLLDKLKGVSIPTASAILTLIDPQNYGIIDIRVWQILYLYGSVRVRPTGLNFSFENWFDYLSKLRHYAKKFNVSPRSIEQILFRHHQNIQEGNLYLKKRVIY